MGVYEQLFDDEENMRMNCEGHWKEGFEEGREEGREEERKAIVSAMISNGMSPEDVSRAAGIPLETVLKLAA